VIELQSGRGRPDYQEQSISPVASRMNSRAGLRGTQPVSIADLGPGPTRTLVASFSSPELRHILKRWQIRHPSGVPMGQVERGDLIELAAQFEVSRALCRLAACPIPPTCRPADRATTRLPGAPIRYREGDKSPTAANEGHCAGAHPPRPCARVSLLRGRLNCRDAESLHGALPCSLLPLSDAGRSTLSNAGRSTGLFVF
jgi:hypothetical protein